MSDGHTVVFGDFEKHEIKDERLLKAIDEALSHVKDEENRFYLLDENDLVVADITEEIATPIRKKSKSEIMLERAKLRKLKNKKNKKKRKKRK